MHGWKHTRTRVEEAIGQKIDEYFDEFDKEALASGSIAQVHIAYVKGQKVAVKVRHPGVSQQIAMDFKY